MRYLWRWLVLVGLMACGEADVVEMKGQGGSDLSPPQMRLHRTDIPDDLWGPDALTETDGVYIEWEASPFSNLVGYRIYRSTEAPERFENIDQTPAAATFYEDASVRLETRYCYRVTAVDSMGAESRMSQAACYTLMRKPTLIDPPNHAMLDAPPTFRWVGVGETGFYTVRVFEDAGLPEQPLREIWRYETVDFDRFEAAYNQDGAAAGPLLPGRQYRWRVDFEERETVGSESMWRFFTIGHEIDD
jgi:hypothetical protein